jgi:capsular polysaccharide biosynthesis protein
MCIVESGRYLTPFQRIGLGLMGAAYDDKRRIILESTRLSYAARNRNIDPVYLPPNLPETMLEAAKEYYFLGHAFNQYGHFILESLPMLSVLFEQPKSTGVFLPFQNAHNVLYKFLDILNIDRSRLMIHSTPSILEFDFGVIKKPIAINDCLIDIARYRNIIDRILWKVSISGERNRKIFVERAPNRMPVSVYTFVRDFFVSAGFTPIIPTDYSIEDQIRLFSEASHIASVPGSQIHNVMFSLPNTTLYEVGDERSRDWSLSNQRICCEISSSKHHFVKYREDVMDLRKDLKNLL